MNHSTEIVIHNPHARLIHAPPDPSNPRYKPILRPGTNKVRADYWKRAVVEPATKGHKPSQMLLSKVQMQAIEGAPAPGGQLQSSHGPTRPTDLSAHAEVEALALIDGSTDAAELAAWGDAEYKAGENARQAVLDAVVSKLKALGATS